ncbi:HAD family hydrolase [Thermosphaera chiliense]|uniref:HAD family hydrolase n=1 Tax=Thermosphaera chiliense TaxID=3402707 RepID=A0A7M1UP68_9CREN|nr:HAD hydrolase-like protein [Thermosphaera aggregans]QOR94030.1 HAD family hydrolase [Thermosphaera aggregans]
MGKALILDIDGTIIPFLVDFESLRERVRRLLGVNEELRPLGLSLERLNVPEELKNQAWELIEKEELESINSLKPNDYEENVETICNLHQSGFKIAMVTNRSSKTAIALLEKINLKNCVDLIITREDGLDRRRQLEKALGSLKAGWAGFLGDTVYDEKAARELNIPFRRVISHRMLPSLIKELIQQGR